MENKYEIVGVAYVGLPTTIYRKQLSFYKSLDLKVTAQSYNEKQGKKWHF